MTMSRAVACASIHVDLPAAGGPVMTHSTTSPP